jgi:regulator of sirC expression with transglutaminase-like and TPR domain
MDTLQLKALIRLVEDPDEIVFKHVRDRLIDCGGKAIPLLEESWEDEELGILFQKRIENIIHDIQFEVSREALMDWHHGDEKDLMRGAILIAKWQYPGLNIEAVYEGINQIKNDIWLEINNKNTILEKIRIFNKVFYKAHGFRGNTEQFHSPLNSFINTVLETRRGNPLSLSVLYSHIAQELGLPIFGVNLPNHFVLACMDKDQISRYAEVKSEFGVLFYINAFSKGSLFDENEIKTFLVNYKLNEERAYFEPCSNTQIIRRMITNLMTSFQEVGNKEKLEELKILRDLLETPLL